MLNNLLGKYYCKHFQPFWRSRMEVYKKDGVLFLVPRNDLVADKFDELRNFFLSELKKKLF